MFKSVVVSLVLLASAVGRAAPSPERLVVLDALQLTPGLEKKGARQRMNDSVTATVKEQGWDPVASTIECHDLMCAGLLAANAKAHYVLVLVGTFSPTNFYARDVGVSLWRDGGIIASRTESDEQAAFAKAGGGTFLSCGPPLGNCAAPLLTSKLMQYAAKLLDDEAGAIRARGTALAAAPPPPGSAVVAPVLASAAPQDSRVGRIVGWSLVGGGAVLVGGGIALWAFNNSGTNCHSVVGDASDCRQYQHTATVAALAGGVGLVAAATGVLVLVTQAGPARIALSVHPSGVIVGGKF